LDKRQELFYHLELIVQEKLLTILLTKLKQKY